MIKEGRHSFAGSNVSEDISKRDQDLNEFLQFFFEKPDLSKQQLPRKHCLLFHKNEASF